VYAPRNSIFAALSESPPDDLLLRLRCDSQSLAYYGDLSQYLCKRFPRPETLSVLDVGPRTGAGLALLRLMHHPQAYTRVKLDPVVGIDLDPAFADIAMREFGDLVALQTPLSGLGDRSHDVVTCSHVLGEQADPLELVRGLARIARRALVVATPLGVAAASGLDIDEACLWAWGFREIEIYESFHFHTGLCALAFMDTSA
jgi:hypothetical protein